MGPTCHVTCFLHVVWRSICHVGLHIGDATCHDGAYMSWGGLPHVEVVYMTNRLDVEGLHAMSGYMPCRATCHEGAYMPCRATCNFGLHEGWPTCRSDCMWYWWAYMPCRATCHVGLHVMSGPTCHVGVHVGLVYMTDRLHVGMVTCRCVGLHAM